MTGSIMTFRTIFVILITFLLFLSATDAKKKNKNKAGNIKNSIYYDSKYNFHFKLPEDWKRKIHKKDDIDRITLTTKKYKEEFHNTSGIPKNKLMNFCDPIISFWIVECELSMYDLLDSIISPGSNNKLKDKLLTLAQPVWEDAVFKRFREDFRKEIYTCGQDAIHWIGYIEYTDNSRRDYYRAGVSAAFTCLDINDRYNMFIAVRTEPNNFLSVMNDLKPYVDSIRFEELDYNR